MFVQFVFFELYSDRRDLHVLTHSVPTRRSSVLLRGNALDLGIDTLVDVLGGDGQRVGALQALVQRLDSLHSLEALAWKNRMCAAFGRRIWCGRRDSNQIGRAHV